MSVPERYSLEWIEHLQRELRQLRRELGLARRLTERLTAGDRAGVEACVREEQTCVAEAEPLRRRRQALLTTAAKHLGIEVAALRLPRLAEQMPAGLRQRFEETCGQLRELGGVCKQVWECNRLLLRTQLNLTRDCLSVLAGPSEEGGYTRRGGDQRQSRGAGGLLDLRG